MYWQNYTVRGIHCFRLYSNVLQVHLCTVDFQPGYGWNVWIGGSVSKLPDNLSPAQARAQAQSLVRQELAVQAQIAAMLNLADDHRVKP